MCSSDLAVVVLGLTETPAGEPAAVLIRNERFAVGETLWELPAGTLEPGEEPAACAGRELEEETGYRAASVEGLCTFYTTPGMTDEKMHAFVARGLEHVGQRLEEDERIEPRVLGVREVMGLVDGGGPVDGKSLTALLVAARRGVLGG